jgi:hypothetical protein
VLEAGIPRERRHVLGALRVADVLGGDRRQRDPVAQQLHGRVVLQRDLVDDVLLRGRGRERESRRNRERCRAEHCALHEVASIDVVGCRHAANSTLFGPARKSVA